MSWFRGAADAVVLEPDCKSMVVYGENGSGKSSFVDAVEYEINDGRIGHLAHEYSGKRQEKAIPNTHKPLDRTTFLTIQFEDNSELKTDIKENGAFTSLGGEAASMSTWNYRRTVLRQNEVADFIHDTKGGKYSALLPLLGLHQMEVAAENLRQLAKSVENESNLREIKLTVRQAKAKQEAVFGSQSEDQIFTTVGNLHAKYCVDNVDTNNDLTRCEALETALNSRISRFSADQKRHLTLQSTAEVDLKGQVNAVRAASMKLAGVTEPLISEKMEVLQSSRAFADKLQDNKEVKCPACGRLVSVEAFQSHINAERARLRDILDIFDTWKAAVATLSDTVKSLKANLGKPDVRSWRDQLASQSLGQNFARLDAFDGETLRTSCAEEDLSAIESELLPLIDVATIGSRNAPPDVQELSIDKQLVETAKVVIDARKDTATAAHVDALISFISSLERGIREEIRLRSRFVIDDISADVQTMWEILNPGTAIDDVRLYLPENTDKAIDIGLKFYGVQQDSPRLTLSESNRNGLGLCIFLAMASRDEEKDRPLFLDDVVVSLDRNHRGMVAELLEKKFSGRQVIILTHDREWYTELRHQLDGKSWSFKALLPWQSPKIGIRWSHKTTTFDDARAHLDERPDSAGNDARKIMDIELALVAESLQLKMPYLRAEKNDRRTAHEFLERIVADGRRCFQTRTGSEYIPHADAIAALDRADRLLTSWANRATHSFDLVRPEAAKLIDTCETAIEFFKCSSCSKSLWFANAAGSESVQCQCGGIRWRYGKA